MAVLLSLHQGDTMLVEYILTETSRAVGRSISDLPLPANAVLVALARRQEVVIHRGGVVLEAGDRVIALTKASDRARLAAALD